jgi:hypothetical protein
LITPNFLTELLLVITLELVPEQLVKVVAVVTQAAAYVNPQKLGTFGLDWS